VDTTIVIIFPAHPAFFAVFLGVAVAYVGYSVYRFVLSLIPGGG
jgi:hypothetical protein